MAVLPVLPVTPEAAELAQRLIEANAMPAEAAVDALHVAVAVVNGVDHLVTWNCAHIANAAPRVKIERACREAGFQAPVICTPEELLQE